MRWAPLVFCRNRGYSAGMNLPDDVGSVTWFRRGAVAAALGPAWIVGVALSSVGALAHDLGMPVWVAGLSTVIVWAGPAQLIFFASLAAGVAPVAILSAMALTGVRFVPMVASLLPRVRTERTSIWAQLLASHFIAVTVWVETMRRSPDQPREARMPFLLGFGTGCTIIATGVTMAGHQMAATLPLPLAAALLFLSPIYFISSLMRGARETMDWAALLLGLALAPAFERLIGGGLDLLATGLVAGGLAFVLRQVGRLRRAGR